MELPGERPASKYGTGARAWSVLGRPLLNDRDEVRRYKSGISGGSVSLLRQRSIPVETMVATFAMGIAAGVVIGWMVKRK